MTTPDAPGAEPSGADAGRAASIAVLVDALLGRGALADALEGLDLSDDAASADLGERAVRAHRENARLRRREHELAALFSSARELAGIRDDGTVLTRLVHRAHQMMGVDVTYLSEFVPATGELHVRETSGSVQPDFQHLRVPPGVGLASAVVESRSPQWVARYDEYPSERHDEGVDDAVASEGLVSLLGVPMLSGDDMLGVLFVANREPYAFAPEEIALLSALADHAAVVLQTVKTLRELRESEEGTRLALGRLTEHLSERDRANTVHQQLVQAVLAGGGFSPVAETLSSALGRAVAIVDARGQLVATAGLPLPAWMLDPSDSARRAIAESRRSGHCIVIDGDDEVDAARGGAVSAITAGSQHFGAVLLSAGALDLGGVDRRTVERAAQVCALLALQQEAEAGADHRAQSELMADLLDDVPERRADVERRALRLGVSLADLDTLILLAVPGEHRTAAARALGPLLDDRALVGEYRGFVMAAWSSARRSIDADHLRERVSRAIRHPVLAVTPPRAAGSLPSAFETAFRTARLLAALEIDDIATSTDEYLPYSAVLDTDARALGAYLRDTIGVVRRYDEERGTDLLGTLRAFVRTNASPTRTARALNFHTNTILQRLERLDRLLGAEWRDDERLFRIGIAVRLDELRERVHRRPRSSAFESPTDQDDS